MITDAPPHTIINKVVSLNASSLSTALAIMVDEVQCVKTNGDNAGHRQEFGSYSKKANLTRKEVCVPGEIDLRNVRGYPLLILLLL
ncbi:MAG: hypothetical protein ACUVRS_02310 [Armatimonadota bacterium]